MPAILAHFQFGMEVLRGLQGEVIDIIRENKSEYALGLQGPDVLFFYKPYTGTYISKTGSLIHQKAGKFFFEKGKMSYEKYKDESLLAYLIGCVCHYCFDKNAHPFVDEKAPVSKLHHKLEAEFDMYISKKYGHTYPRNSRLPVKVKNSEVLGDIYNISGKQFADSLGDMRRYSAILENRKFVETAEKLVGKKEAFSCMSPPVVMAYEAETEIMDDIMHSSVEECRSMIYQLCEYIKGELAELNGFELNFEGK